MAIPVLRVGAVGGGSVSDRESVESVSAEVVMSNTAWKSYSNELYYSNDSSLHYCSRN